MIRRAFLYFNRARVRAFFSCAYVWAFPHFNRARVWAFSCLARIYWRAFPYLVRLYIWIFPIIVIYVFIQWEISVFFGVIIVGMAYMIHISFITKSDAEEYIDYLFKILMQPPDKKRPPSDYLLAVPILCLPPLVAGAISGHFIPLTVWEKHDTSIIVFLGVIYAAMLTRSSRSVSSTNLDCFQKKELKETLQTVIRHSHFLSVFVLTAAIILLAADEKLIINSVMSFINSVISIINFVMHITLSTCIDVWGDQFCINADEYSYANEPDVMGLMSSIIGFLLALVVIVTGFNVLIWDYRIAEQQIQISPKFKTDESKNSN